MRALRVSDPWLLGTTVVLLGMGIVMVYSASAVVGLERFGDPSYFGKRQILFGTVGLLGGLVLMGMDYDRWRLLAYPLCALSLLSLIAVLVPGIGREVGGCQAVVSLGPPFGSAGGVRQDRHDPLPGPFSLRKAGKDFQGSLSASRPRGWGPHDPRSPSARHRDGTLDGVCRLRPPLCGRGTAPSPAGDGGGYLPGAFRLHPFGRIPEASPHHLFGSLGRSPGVGVSVDPVLSLAGPGGWTGAGLAQGKAKLLFLPEPHTDFIFSVVGEELGYLGALGLMFLFGLLIFRGARVAFRCDNSFGALLAAGLTSLLGTQTLIHLAVGVGLLPTKGLPLPFISTGGSALLVSLASVGILLSIAGGKGDERAR